MAILEKQIIENKGLIKEIDDASFGLIVSTMQTDIYHKPIPSSVRETFSNAYDANVEKEGALAIISGKDPVEKYYAEMDDRSFVQSSAFDKDYYNEKYMSNKSTVDVVYTEGDGKDSISFRDYGVGLYGKRLAGFFKIGWSSKRLSKSTIGRVGAGSKSPLATNVEYFIMETWYNGLYTKFMIYENYFKCITPKKDCFKTTEIKGKREVDNKIVDAIEYVHWVKTDELNGVKISWDVKKHNKEHYFDAIRNQLLYFQKRLHFTSVDRHGQVNYHNGMFPRILYEDDYLIVTDDVRFSRPHILINRVNYGALDSDELGLNKMFGSVAVKADSSEIDITASRESVKYTDKTRNFIIQRVGDAAEVAGNIVIKELDKIKNPIEKYNMTSQYASFFNENDKVELLNQLKKFSGTFNPKIIVNGADYGVPEAGKVNFRQLTDYVEDMSMVIATANGNAVNATYPNSLASLGEFKNVYWFDETEEKFSLRASTISYLTQDEKVAKFLFFKDVKDSLMTEKEFSYQSKLTTDKTNKSYKRYLSRMKAKILHRKLIKAIIKEYSKPLSSVDLEAVKAHAKTMNLNEDPAIKKRSKGNQQFRVLLSTKSNRDIQAELNRKLKKEKAILPFKTYHCWARLNEDTKMFLDYGEPTGHFRMAESRTEVLLESDTSVVYADNNTKDLLMASKFIYSLIGNNKTPGILDGYREDAIVFITISKQNEKFFKQMKNSLEVKSFIKPVHKLENGVMSINLGPEIQKFITMIYIHELIYSNYLYNFLYFSDEIELLKGLIPDKILQIFLKVSVRLGKFPAPYTGDISTNSSYAMKFADKAHTILGTDTDKVKQFVESLKALSAMQELPISELSADTKEALTDVKELKVLAYDKELIETLTVELGRLRPVLEILVALSPSTSANLRYGTTVTELYKDKLVEACRGIYTEEELDVTPDVVVTEEN